MSARKKDEEELLQAEKAEKTDYAAMRDELLEGLLQAEPFAFDLNTDALYNQYRDLYIRQGNDAAGNAFGKAASLTGGYANSYADSIAAQTYNDYMLALQDKGQQLYDRAYDRYRDGIDRKTDLYTMADSLEREEYDRSVQQEKTDYERRRDEEQTAYDREKYAEQTAYEREKYAEKTDYERQKYEQEKAYEHQQDSTAADYESKQDMLSFALKMAQMGDFSFLKNIGVDVSVLEANAKKQANAPEKISVTIQNNAEEIYYYNGYNSLVRYLNRQIAYGQITEAGKQQVIKALTGR